jgi:alkylation response protein AidB-like acyl-CoA dehydrogenase
MNNGELVFEDMQVPADHLLVEGDALGKAGVYFRPGKIIQAANNLGVGMRAFEITVRALLERASAAVDANAPDADALCNMVKVFASEEILKVAQHAVELHGGNGLMLDFGVEKLLRDAAIFLHWTQRSTSPDSRS